MVSSSCHGFVSFVKLVSLETATRTYSHALIYRLNTYIGLHFNQKNTSIFSTLSLTCLMKAKFFCHVHVGACWSHSWSCRYYIETTTKLPGNKINNLVTWRQLVEKWMIGKLDMLRYIYYICVKTAYYFYINIFP